MSMKASGIKIHDIAYPRLRSPDLDAAGIAPCPPDLCGEKNSALLHCTNSHTTSLLLDMPIGELEPDPITASNISVVIEASVSS